jgi:hypothetical protein
VADFDENVKYHKASQRIHNFAMGYIEGDGYIEGYRAMVNPLMIRNLLITQKHVSYVRNNGEE